MNMEIPFLDLVTPHVELEAELVSVFRSALTTASFVGGPMVEGFESDFAEFCGTRYCVGVNSGTDALRFALMAAGVRPGESVITVPNTFIATTEAIGQAGALPEFVDIDEHTYNLDPTKLRAFLEDQCDLHPLTGRPVSRRTGRTVTAVVPVHLYGQPADMDRILDLTEKYKLIVVEDACQAHGSEYFSRKEQSWRKAGSMGVAAAFSFYPGKNLGACGEAGAVTTNDESLAKKLRQLRDHGQVQKYYHDIEGYNGRLDAIQAGILRLKLCHLSEWNRLRRAVAGSYRELLAGIDGLILPFEPSWARSNYHLYVVRVRDREDLRNSLAAVKIGTGIHYPVPLHLQNAHSSLGYHEGDFPVAETTSAEIVSLPMFPQLSRSKQEYVAEKVWEYFGRSADSLSRGEARIESTTQSLQR
jgi:dTDP-4-amino-4,6-dideoxygalactose transaminase